jgi:predicted deacylase
MANSVALGSVAAIPGSKTFGWLDVCTMADGSPLRIPVHVVAGSQSGPRLTVLSAQHGDEISDIEVCHQVIKGLDPKALRGTLVVVPVANPIAFERGTRSTWVDSLYGDNGNMNRVWPGRPGPDGWLTERMVYLLAEQLIKGSDAVVDLHDGYHTLPIYYGYAFTTEDREMTRRIRELSVASGFEILIKQAVPTLGGNLSNFAINQGIPCVACEVGEFYGFQLTETEKPTTKPVRTIPECGVTAIYNIMKKLGMLEGQPKLPSRQVLISPGTHNLRPKHGGLLYSEFTPDAIGRVVPKGTLLGTVVSPYDFAVLHEIRTILEHSMIIAMNYAYPCVRVNTGDYGYIVADMATAEWITHSLRTG